MARSAFCGRAATGGRPESGNASEDDQPGGVANLNSGSDDGSSLRSLWSVMAKRASWRNKRHVGQVNRGTTWCATTGNVQPHAVPGHACRLRCRAFALAVSETHASERLGQDRPRRSGFVEQRCQTVVVLSHPVIERRPKRTRTRRLERRSDLLHPVAGRWSLAPYRCPWEISLRLSNWMRRAACRASVIPAPCQRYDGRYRVPRTRHSGATALEHSQLLQTIAPYRLRFRSRLSSPCLHRHSHRSRV